MDNNVQVKVKGMIRAGDWVVFKNDKDCDPQLVNKTFFSRVHKCFVAEVKTTMGLRIVKLESLIKYRYARGLDIDSTKDTYKPGVLLTEDDLQDDEKKAA